MYRSCLGAHKCVKLLGILHLESWTIKGTAKESRWHVWKDVSFEYPWPWRWMKPWHMLQHGRKTVFNDRSQTQKATTDGIPLIGNVQSRHRDRKQGVFARRWGKGWGIVLICVHPTPKILCWSPNGQYLQMWPWLEMGSVLIQLGWRCTGVTWDVTQRMVLSWMRGTFGHRQACGKATWWQNLG